MVSLKGLIKASLVYISVTRTKCEIIGLKMINMLSNYYTTRFRSKHSYRLLW